MSVTTEQLMEILLSIKSTVDDLSRRSDDTDAKIDKLDAKVDGLVTRVDGLEIKVDGLGARVDTLEKSLNDFRGETTERILRKEIAERYGSRFSSAFCV